MAKTVETQEPAPPGLDAMPPDAIEAEFLALLRDAGGLVRDIVRPCACEAREHYERTGYLDEAVKLMKAAARVGDTVARLRGGVGFHQRISVDRTLKITDGNRRLPPPPPPEAEAKK